MGTLAILPTVLLTLNLAAFPWDYSMFGSLRRATLPRDAEGLRLRGGIVIGRHFRQAWPGVGYLFHPQGLGMNIEFVGVAFVPAENIGAHHKETVAQPAFDRTQLPRIARPALAVLPRSFDNRTRISPRLVPREVATGRRRRELMIVTRTKRIQRTKNIGKLGVNLCRQPAPAGMRGSAVRDSRR